MIGIAAYNLRYILLVDLGFNLLDFPLGFFIDFPTFSAYQTSELSNYSYTYCVSTFSKVVDKKGYTHLVRILQFCSAISTQET